MLIMIRVLILILFIITISVSAMDENTVLPELAQYGSIENPKALGLDIRFDYPKAWESKEVKLDNAVQTIVYNNSKNGISSQITIYCERFPTFRMTYGEIYKKLKDEITPVKLFNQFYSKRNINAQYLGGKKIEFNNLPAYKYNCSLQFEELGADCFAVQRILSIFYKNYIVTFVCSTSGTINQKIKCSFPVTSKQNIFDSFRSDENIYNNCINSLSINDFN